MRRINSLEIGFATFFISIFGMISFHSLLNISLRDSLISVLLGSVIGLIPILMYLYINKKNSDGIILFNKYLFGKHLGLIINIISIFLMFLNVCFLTSYATSYIQTWYLQLTPSLLLILVLLIIAIYAFSHGSGTLFRSVNMFFYLLVPIIFILVIGIINKIEISNLFPILENGFYNPFLGSILYAVYTSTLIFPFLVVPNTKIVDKDNNKDIVLFYFLGQICNLFLIFAITTVIDPNITSIYTHPEYLVFSKVSIFSSIEKLQSIIASSVILVLFVQITFSLYYVYESILQLFKLKHSKKRRVMIPLLIITGFGASYFMQNTISYMTYFYPILLLIVIILFSLIFMKTFWMNNI